jgi:cleavage stimulation factor subunit 2
VILITLGVHEPQIIEWLSNVGQVTSFRLIDDHQTKQSKGYGFATFADQDTAEAAIRNLNGAEWNGRQIKVDWPNATDKDLLSRPAGAPTATPAAAAPTQTSLLPQLPPGMDLNPNVTAEDAISKTLSALPATQLLDILTQMQGLVQQDPSRAQALLEQSPQLSYAIFQVLLNLKLVDTQTLSAIASTAAVAQPAAPQPPPQAYPPQAPPSIPPQQQQQYAAPPPHPQYGQVPPPGQFPLGGTPVPQAYQSPYQQPPSAPPVPQAAPPSLLGAVGGNREQLIQTLLSMTADQIRNLGASPQETEQLLAVWTQLKAGQGR